MNIDQMYNETLEKLKNNQRVWWEFSGKDASHIKKDLLETLAQEDHTRLKKLLCICCYSKRPVAIWGPFFVRVLSQVKYSHLHIHCLDAVGKHIIQFHKLSDSPYPDAFIESMRDYLLQQEDPELLLWQLQLIEDMGQQARPLWPIIESKSPQWYQLWSKKCRQIFDLIKRLELKMGPS